MVNNSRNINKTSNHISPQYIEHKKKQPKKPKQITQHMTLGIQVLVLNKHNHVAGLNLILGSQTPS